MPAPTPPRRHFLASTQVPAAALCALGTTGCQSSTPLRDLRFATLMDDLGLPRREAHDAVNDAVMAALAFIKLRHLAKLKN